MSNSIIENVPRTHILYLDTLWLNLASDHSSGDSREINSLLIQLGFAEILSHQIVAQHPFDK